MKTLPLGEKHTWEKKIEVAQKYQQLGNMRLVSELTGVNYQTIVDWRKTTWWIELMEELKQLRKVKTSTKLSEIIELSIQIVQDRLENGDWVLNNKTGEIMRKPVSLKDAAQVTNNLITRQVQMEELAEKLVNRKDTIKETLTILAKEFAKMNKEYKKMEATDIASKDIVDGTGIVQLVENHPDPKGSEVPSGGSPEDQVAEQQR